MRNFINKLRKMHRNNLFYLLTAVQTLCIVTYGISSRNLEKPAGLIEALKFFFTKPDEYFLSILVGIVAWIIVSLLILSLIGEIPFLQEFLEDDGYSYNRIVLEELPSIKIIINLIITIALFIANIIFLKFLWSLLLFILTVIVFMFLITKGNN